MNNEYDDICVAVGSARGSVECQYEISSRISDHRCRVGGRIELRSFLDTASRHVNFDKAWVGFVFVRIYSIFQSGGEYQPCN